jgi:hypothetical protein
MKSVVESYFERLTKEGREVFLYFDKSEERDLLVIETEDAVGYGKNLTEACCMHMINKESIAK